MAKHVGTAQKARLLRDFDRTGRALAVVLASHYGDAAAAAILSEARRAFEALIPQLPDVGVKRQARDITGASYGLALYKALVARGRPIEEIARVHHAFAVAAVASMPWQARLTLRLMRALLSTRPGKGLFKAVLKRRLARQQAEPRPGAAVGHYVEGDGVEFDCGIDITRCPILDLYRAQGAGEFARYACLYDFLASKQSGTGLLRTMTLAEGADRCDDRFRLGKEPVNRQRTRADLS